jgi:hypothetical protein
MSAMRKPIVFLLGPSGSGKTQLAEWVAKDLQFVHIEIDRWPEGDGIDLAGLRKEWDAFLGSGQATDLASAICTRVNGARKDGAILSFPSNFVLPTPLMEAAEEQGLRFLILYGTGAECLEAFLRRERQTGRGLDADHWILNNAGTYAEFSRPEFSTHRLMGFEQSRHRVRGDLVAEAMRRLTNG